MAPLWLTIGSLSLGETSRVFDGSATFEVGLDAIPTTDLFDAFTKTLCVGYDNVTLILDFNCWQIGALLVPPSLTCLVDPVESFLHLVQSPFRVYAFGESLPEVVLFLLEQLRLAAHSGGPMEKDNTLKERTVMEVSDIILLLEFCLKNTYLSFQDQFY